jgi:hypothetical protein
MVLRLYRNQTHAEIEQDLLSYHLFINLFYLYQKGTDLKENENVLVYELIPF